MIPNHSSTMQPPHLPRARHGGQACCLCGSAEPLSTWHFRRLAEQAARLYDSPDAQQLALLHHASIMRAHAPTLARRRLWGNFARALERDRTGARRGER